MTEKINCVLFSEEGNQANTRLEVASYPGLLTQVQWRSQEIAFARAQRGHTMFVRTSAQSAEDYWGVWGHPPPENLEILQPPRSVLRPYTIAKCKSLMANSRMMSV